MDVDEPQTSAQILEYAALLRDLDAVAMENEYRAVTRAARDAPTAMSSLQLALLLSHHQSPHYDLDAAIATLDGVVADTAGIDSELSGVASLLLTLLDDRRRIESALEDLAGGTVLYSETVVEGPVDEDEVDADTEALQVRVRALLAELEQERERGRRLEAQLRGLIELEEQLNQGAVALDE